MRVCNPYKLLLIASHRVSFMRNDAFNDASNDALRVLAVPTTINLRIIPHYLSSDIFTNKLNITTNFQTIFL
jgi:hypothetical protein